MIGNLYLHSVNPGKAEETSGFLFKVFRKDFSMSTNFQFEILARFEIYGFTALLFSVL